MARPALCIHAVVVRLFLTGLPHSDISGSKRICRSPELFAAYHVLLRLLAPRHPSCALCSLINLILTPSKAQCRKVLFSLKTLVFQPHLLQAEQSLPISKGATKARISSKLYFLLTLMCRCQRTVLRLKSAVLSVWFCSRRALQLD